MQIRINKFLADAGICSRRRADEFIEAGRVTINGKKIFQLGTKVDPQKDEVFFDDKKINARGEKAYVYYALNKPIGYASTSKDKFNKYKVTDLVPRNPRVFAVGRLDKNSQGLMILTNDGELTNLLTHPRYEHEKEYEVGCFYGFKDAEKAQRQVKKFERGVMLTDGKTQPSEIRINKVSNDYINFNIILKEGRKRQIRRMCSKFKLEVAKLKRIRIGKLVLDDIPEGKYRIIKKEEII